MVRDWSIVVAGRHIRLRPETASDASFLLHLFQSATPALDGLPPEMAQNLVSMQWRSQTATYRASYPQAWFAIIELDGAAAGRLVFDPGAVSWVVDYALLPDERGAGLGSAILAAVLARAGGPVRCSVLVNNHASLAMCRRLGFVVVGEDGAHLELEWPCIPR